jgi:radical SAM/Cys-rich protein
LLKKSDELVAALDLAENDFDRRVIESTGSPLSGERIRVIQMNIGLTCNLACIHCHVASSPRRKEQMNRETMAHVLRVAREVDAELIDITGGAPEMNPHFKEFVAEARGERFPVQVRTNLTILLEPGYEDYAEFMASHGVVLVASLPCYLEANVDGQRGEGVYTGSIEAIRRLNALGYGVEGGLQLDLVYNPTGPSLPPDQTALESDYRRELEDRFDITFSRLVTITNMPIGRFMSQLKKHKQAEGYRELLHNAFNPGTVAPLMCRHQIDIDWDGNMYDCDFNLALRMPVNHGLPSNIRDFDPALHDRRIVTGDHCFGCTAGSGSSCGGALV